MANILIKFEYANALICVNDPSLSQM